MSPGAAASLGLLVVYAAAIWFRDTGWAAGWADTLPVLAALPLAWWLGRPWRLRRSPAHIPPALLASAALLSAVGGVGGWIAVMAAGWTLLVGLWMRAYVEPGAGPSRLRLLPLLFLGFPWMALELPMIGWSFRLSGAAVVGGIFDLLRLDVQRSGTDLLVQGLTLSVEPACGGLNVLQALLVAGACVVHMKIDAPRAYWLCLLALPVMAWLANTARIFTLSFTALTFGSEFARGAWHSWGGWLALCLMFLACVSLFDWIGRRTAGRGP